MPLDTRSALLIVDVQNDFCSGGALAVPDAERVIPVINHAVDRFTAAGAPVYASRDWHPAESVHFEEFGGHWPVHCVTGTAGAEFQSGLHLPHDAVIVSKGVSGEDDGYSAFEGVISGGSDLATDLQQKDISHLYIAGLATDFCVKASALDALRQRLEVTVLTDAVAGLDSTKSTQALGELERAGASHAQTTELA